jgi:hypothetical protein
MKRPYIADALDHISPAALDDSSAKIIPPGSLLMVVREMILAHSFPFSGSSNHRETGQATWTDELAATASSSARTSVSI